MAGFTASLAMLTLLYVLPSIGAPRLNVFGELSTVSPHSDWWAAPLEYLILGAIVFPTFYSTLLFKDLSGQPWQKGLMWGLILWAVRGIVVMPIMGQGFFSVHSAHPIASVIETFVGHALYGILLGAIAGDLSSQRIKIVKSKVPSKR